MSPKKSQLTIFPAPAELTASPLYEVTVNGQPVFVYPCTVSTVADETGKLRPDRHQLTLAAPAAFATFDFSGEVRVQVRVLAAAKHLPLTGAVLRPQRYPVATTVAGETISFTLTRAGQYSVEPNGSILAPLLIFANAPEVNPPTPETPGIRYFGPGVHILGYHDQVKSDSSYYLAGGAVVYGHFSGSEVRNVKIFGRGILDCSRSPGEEKGWGARNEYGMNTRQMRWFKCQDLTLDGLIMLDSPSWGIEINHCDRVTVNNVKIITWRGASDAIDVCSSEQVRVSDSFMRTHDDTLNVKGLTDLGYPGGKVKGTWSPAGVRKPARHITFERCVVWNDRAHGLMVGPETRTTEISAVLFKDIDIIHALSVDAIGIYSGDAAVIRDIRYEGIRIEDPRVMTLINLRAHPTYVTADETQGPVSDIVFKDLEIFTPTPVYSAICADKAPIGPVTFENIRLNGLVARTAEELKLHTRNQVGEVRILPAPEK